VALSRFNCPPLFYDNASVQLFEVFSNFLVTQNTTDLFFLHFNPWSYIWENFLLQTKLKWKVFESRNCNLSKTSKHFVCHDKIFLKCPESKILWSVQSTDLANCAQKISFCSSENNELLGRPEIFVKIYLEKWVLNTCTKNLWSGSHSVGCNSIGGSQRSSCGFVKKSLKTLLKLQISRTPHHIQSNR